MPETDEHCRSFDGKIAEEIAKLRKEAHDHPRRPAPPTTHQKEINNLHQMLLALEKLVQKTTTEINTNISNVVNNKIDLRLPDILKNISINLAARSRSWIDKNTKKLDHGCSARSRS